MIQPRRNHWAVLAVMLVGALFFASTELTTRLLGAHATTFERISTLEREEEALDKTLLQTAFLLYTSFDPLHAHLAELRQVSDALLADHKLDRSAFAEVHAALLDYRALVDEKEGRILRFGTLNALIKNAVSHIAALGSRYTASYGSDHSPYLRHMAQATASVFRISRGFDLDPLETLRESYDALAALPLPEAAEQAKLIQTFMVHVRLFIDTYPQYQESFETLRALPSEAALERVRSAFLAAAAERARQIRYITLALGLLFLACVVLVLLVLKRLDTSHRALTLLHGRFTQAAHSDRLTHVRNRFAFEQAVAEAPADAVLLLFNIDRFGAINDLYGHTSGDQLLKQVAAILSAHFAARPDYRLYRLGSDQFGLFCSPLQEPLEQVADALRAKVEGQRLHLKGHAVAITITLGMSRAAPWLEHADLALKAAKRAGLKQLEYRPELGEESEVAHNLARLEAVQCALDEGRVVPWFQPILDLRHDRVSAYECLLRVVDADGAVALMPGELLPLAERGRLRGPLTQVMLERSFEAFAQSDLDFHLNLSAHDLGDPQVEEHLDALLARYPGSGARLVLELRAGEQEGQWGALEGFITRMRLHGVRIAIDDFGGDHASLVQLLRLPVDTLKIDGALIRDIDRNPDAQALVESLVQLVSRIAIRHTCAEFVHSAEVLETVRRLGVDYAQGFYIGKPAPEIGKAAFTTENREGAENG